MKTAGFMDMCQQKVRVMLAPKIAKEVGKIQNIYRKEMKYVIKLTDFYKLQQILIPYVNPDTNSNNHSYWVRSLYFDTLNDKDLYDVLNGQLNKSKIRLRLYNLNDPYLKLELKQKHNSNGIKKNLLISKAEAKKMINGDYDFLLNKPNQLANKLYYMLKLLTYRAKIIVSYNRFAYTYKTNNTRITFDFNIGSSLTTKNFLNKQLSIKPVLSSNLGILEVKFNNFLMPNLQTILQTLNSLPQSYSKYANARLAYF